MITFSSTEAEFVAADEFVGKLLWKKWFLGEQGYVLQKIILYQDKKSLYSFRLKGDHRLEKDQEYCF